MKNPSVPNDPNQSPTGGPGYGPPPPAAHPGVEAPAPKKGRKKLVLGIVGGLLALCCVGGTIAAVASGGDSKPEAGDSTPTTAATKGKKADEKALPKAAAPKAPPTNPTGRRDASPGLGDAVRDGKFEFTVTKVDCSRSKIGSEYLNKKAQGKFCQISLTVKNIGDEAQTFDGSSQKAMDATGTEFSNDGAAETYANQDNSTFLNEINPGNQTKGKVIFDVPKSTTLTKLELHDSPFSGGVTVGLS
jgi:pyruvate/2-oxoglutarate dehydrogenase complex dihydrolipoamide acyltransferase (E2) component